MTSGSETRRKSDRDDLYIFFINFLPPSRRNNCRPVSRINVANEGEYSNAETRAFVHRETILYLVIKGSGTNELTTQAADILSGIICERLNTVRAAEARPINGQRLTPILSKTAVISAATH